MALIYDDKLCAKLWSNKHKISFFNFFIGSKQVDIFLFVVFLCVSNLGSNIRKRYPHALHHQVLALEIWILF